MKQFMSFQPLLPVNLILVLAIIALIIILVGLFLRKQGALLRLLALAALVLALANPVMVEEQREPIKSIVGIVVDRSPSQNYGTRTRDTDDTLNALKEEFKKHPEYEPRFIEAASQSDMAVGTETKLFTPLNQAIADVPPALYAGTVLITDGQVHDIASVSGSVVNEKPINALITGQPDEFDREIKFVEPPRFGITNKKANISVLVNDKGHTTSSDKTATVSIKVNGEAIGQYNVTIGAPYQIELTIPHAGKNIIEAATEPLEGELTTANNETVTVIEGIRQNLRVLLVSGEPHNGERTWRDLLKSDASIDLVHFTILRPPEKSDNTPLSQLSLIVFPTTELFVDKINDFDLVIFDRYQHYDVLPLIYYDYVAEYVKNGGALLMATGPEFAGDTSLAQTPLISVLPTLPSGEIIEKPFRPSLTKDGMRHPVTRDLETKTMNSGNWGRWMRQITVGDTSKSTVIMNGADNRPLMLLSHIGKGRVGMLLSDEGWLWARGFEGGGPYAALYRRMAHWLMKEPDLEEEALTASSNGNNLTIRRQTMADKPETATVTSPSGKTQTVTLEKQQEGVFVANLPTNEVGLFKIINGDKLALTHIGPMNSPEYAELISTDEKLTPVVSPSGGHITRLHAKASEKISMPGITPIDNNARTKNIKADTIALLKADQTKLVNTVQYSIYTGLLALFICLLLLSGMWYKEGH